MTNKEKLELVKKLLQEIADNWNEDEVKHYGSKLSFDDLSAEVRSVELK